MGHLLDICRRAGGEGAGDYHYARAGHSEGCDPGVGGAGEGAGDYAEGRDALGLGDYCVVETPRRAGPSIPLRRG